MGVSTKKASDDMVHVNKKENWYLDFSQSLYEKLFHSYSM